MILRPALTWIDGRFRRDREIEVESGIIRSVRATEQCDQPTQLILPGFVNAHSHAFQRALRGRGETFPSGQGSFWTWREAMYGLVEAMDRETFLRTCVGAFREMLAAGITTVGEFHYLHHLPGSDGYELDDALIEAAEVAGIRLVLLQAYYHTGGFGQPLQGGQKQFGSADPDAYWKRMDELSGRVELGCVLHSVRAASRDDLVKVRAEAKRRGLVTHIHLEEQRREIDECTKFYGMTPMRLVLEAMGVDESLTAVHCTHSDPEEMRHYRELGGRICVCPLTEANLGDGVPGPWGAVSLGTDSNARISMLEEMRWLEYGQRLRREKRGCLLDAHGEVAPGLLKCATAEGADALGIPAGRVAEGHFADFVSVDLAHPALLGWTDETLAAMLTFGVPDSVISGTCVGGRWL